jgi:hypothetical protein
MAFGTPGPGALQYPVVAPAAQQLAQAAHAAPQANADEAEKMAATKANTEIDKSGQLDAELKQSQTQDAMLNRLAAVPGIEQSPMGQKMLTERFKTLGIPLPKTELGQIDMKAVRAIIAPPVKAWNQWTPAEINAQRELPAELRVLPADAPETMRTAPAMTPLTQKGADFLHAPVARAEAALAAGHGNLQALLMAARHEQAALKAKGADTSAVDTILTPEGNLRPEYAVQKASELAQAQIDNMRSLGIVRADAETLKETAVANQMTRWNTQSANSKASTDVQSQKLRVQVSQFAQKMEVARGNLAARIKSATNSSTANLLKMGQMGINAYDKNVEQLGKAQTDAEGELRGVQAAISSMRFTPNFDPTDPAFVTLMDTAKVLTTTVSDGRTTFENARVMAATASSSIFNSITGNTGLQPTININNGGAPGQTFGSGGGSAQFSKGSAVPDAPGYKFNGVKNADGTLQAVGPDGKVRPWKPA